MRASFIILFLLRTKQNKSDCNSRAWGPISLSRSSESLTHTHTTQFGTCNRNYNYQIWAASFSSADILLKMNCLQNLPRFLEKISFPCFCSLVSFDSIWYCVLCLIVAYFRSLVSPFLGFGGNQRDFTWSSMKMLVPHLSPIYTIHTQIK